MRRRRRRRDRRRRGGGSYAGYAGKVLSYSPLVYFPGWEIAGSLAEDIANALNGTYVGVLLGATGIGDGYTVPTYDGSLDYMDIDTPGLRALYNGREGSFMIWAKMLNAGVWTDGTGRRCASLHRASTDRIILDKPSSNTLRVYYRAGGTVTSISVAGQSSADWMCLLVTWSKTADAVIFYINGSEADRGTSLGAYSGTLTDPLIGCQEGHAGAYWRGWLGHAAIFANKVITPAEAADLYIIP